MHELVRAGTPANVPAPAWHVASWPNLWHGRLGQHALFLDDDDVARSLRHDL